MSKQLTKQELQTQLTEARQALKLAEWRGLYTEIRFRQDVITALENKLAAVVLAEQAPTQRVKIAEVCAAGARVVEKVTFAETGRYIAGVWTPTKPRQPTREDIQRAEQALDLVSKKYFG